MALMATMAWVRGRFQERTATCGDAPPLEQLEPTPRQTTIRLTPRQLQMAG